MQKLYLPHVNLPEEFVKLLRMNLSVTASSGPILDLIRPNQALYFCLETAFAEFDVGLGLEKTMIALGWPNFRERMASIFVYKAIHGHYPQKTSMDLVEEIKNLESRYVDHSIHGISRIFLLGFYLMFANLQIQRRENNKFLHIKFPHELNRFLRLSNGRSDKLDWLVLILMHLEEALGEKLLENSLIAGKKMDEIYSLMTPESRNQMHNNLLAYGASINEPDIFLYDKV
jgi:hypothetical protein